VQTHDAKLGKKDGRRAQISSVGRKLLYEIHPRYRTIVWLLSCTISYRDIFSLCIKRFGLAVSVSDSQFYQCCLIRKWLWPSSFQTIGKRDRASDHCPVTKLDHFTEKKIFLYVQNGLAFSPDMGRPVLLVMSGN
jgi:hypothetical protein